MPHRQPDYFGDIVLIKAFSLKLFEGETLIGSQRTTLSLRFYEYLLYSVVIFKCVIDLEDSFKRNSKQKMG